MCRCVGGQHSWRQFFYYFRPEPLSSGTWANLSTTCFPCSSNCSAYRCLWPSRSSQERRKVKKLWGGPLPSPLGPPSLPGCHTHHRVRRCWVSRDSGQVPWASHLPKQSSFFSHYNSQIQKYIPYFLGKLPVENMSASGMFSLILNGEPGVTSAGSCCQENLSDSWPTKSYFQFLSSSARESADLQGLVAGWGSDWERGLQRDDVGSKPDVVMS